MRRSRLILSLRSIAVHIICITNTSLIFNFQSCRVLCYYPQYRMVLYRPQFYTPTSRKQASCVMIILKYQRMPLRQLCARLTRHGLHPATAHVRRTWVWNLTQSLQHCFPVISFNNCGRLIIVCSVYLCNIMNY